MGPICHGVVYFHVLHCFVGGHTDCLKNVHGSVTVFDVTRANDGAPWTTFLIPTWYAYNRQAFLCIISYFPRISFHLSLCIDAKDQFLPFRRRGPRLGIFINVLFVTKSHTTPYRLRWCETHVARTESWTTFKLPISPWSTRRTISSGESIIGYWGNWFGEKRDASSIAWWYVEYIKTLTLIESEAIRPEMNCLEGMIYLDKSGHQVAYCAQNPCKYPSENPLP